MNKRIQELYKQAHITQEKQVRAGGWDNDREPFEYRTVIETNFDPEKFAELIVKECAGLFPNVYVSIENDYGHAPVIASDYIKKHFGLEE
jgi:hypothetical protein